MMNAEAEVANDPSIAPKDTPNNKEVDLLAKATAISSIEKAWSKVPRPAVPVRKTTVQEVESEGGYWGILIAALGFNAVLLPFTAFLVDLWGMMNSMTGLISAEAVTLLPAFFLVGLTDMLSMKKSGKSITGLLETRVLRKKKMRQLKASEDLEYATALMEYKKAHKKQRKIEAKILTRVQSIIDEYNQGSNLFDLEFTDGKFSKKQKDQQGISIEEMHLEIAQEMPMNQPKALNA